MTEKKPKSIIQKKKEDDEHKDKKIDERAILNLINKLISNFDKLNTILEQEIDDSHELSNFKMKKNDYFQLLRNVEKKYAEKLSQN